MADHDDGELTIKAGGQELAGWTEVDIIRGVEVCPSLFHIAMTEKFAADSPSVVMAPGDPCVVSIGGEPVITGYVDRLIPQIRGKTQHWLAVEGRSKSQDMVDCSAEWPGGQIKGSSVLEIAKKLASVYKDLTVEGAVDTGPPLPQFNLTIGETAYSIIERLARFRKLLIYDLPNGNLTLAQAGKDKMGSGLKQGENIQDAQCEYSADQRFSVYEAFITATDTLFDIGDGGNLLAKETDDGIKRHRLRTMISEGGALGNDVAKQRAVWEKNRQAGRSQTMTATVDSWKDSGGKLWTPNASIPIDAPALKLPEGITWVISQVRFRRSLRDGTTADLVIMPKGAFEPEPIVLPGLNGLPGEIGTK